MIQREGPDTVAAFIAEPVMGAGGAVTFRPQGYFEAINAVLAKYDILFIADEVITGFGRTGEMFGTTTYKMKADTLSCAKALTSAYFPLSAVLINEPVYEVLVDQSRKIGTFGHGNTYAGHPVGCAVAVKTLEIYQRDRIIEHVRKVAPIFLQRLGKLAEHPLVGEARGVGLIGGVELVKDKASKAQFDPLGKVGAYFFERGHHHGVLIRNVQDSIAICPPLVVTESDVDEIVRRLSLTLDDTLAFARKTFAA
jgi:4-aminobutyrate--pyruvate transaminase